ncbi:MAG TPA: biotin/lipoyl-binding protein, partial [Kofleriaceae bacterium]|nr:biotin/lipoyl-binding protein [Kofleriaceae bacterium]
MPTELSSPEARAFLSRLRGGHYTPVLRQDLVFTPDPATRQVRMSIGHGPAGLVLGELECFVAQQMSGTRSLEELVAFARQYRPSFDRTDLEGLLVALHARGMLLDPSARAAVPPPVPGFRAPAEEDDFSDETMPDWSMGADPLLARGSGVARHVDVAPPNAGSWPAATPVPDPPDAAHAPADPSVVVDDRYAPGGQADGHSGDHPGAYADAQPHGYGEPQGDEQPVEEPPEPDGAEAEQEQEEIWQEARAVKWHQRTSVRVALILGALLLLTAVIPYPLKVKAEAVVVPTERVYVRAEIEGLITEILVDEGQAVKKGDVLARLDDRALQTERRKALAELERITAELEKLSKGARPEEIARQRALVAAAANEVSFARRDAARKRRMAREGVGSVQQRDAAQTELRVKEKALAEAKAALRLLQAGARQEELAAREAERDRAQAQLAHVDTLLEDTVIRAPMDGVVITPRFRERLNERVEAGGLVCEIA